MQVGRIPLAKSINRRHFSFILKIVLGSSVPLSSSLIEVIIILVILDGGTFVSHKMLINCSSLEDKSFCKSSVACSLRGGC